MNDDEFRDIWPLAILTATLAAIAIFLFAGESKSQTAEGFWCLPDTEALTCVGNLKRLPARDRDRAEFRTWEQLRAQYERFTKIEPQPTETRQDPEEHLSAREPVRTGPLFRTGDLLVQTGAEPITVEQVRVRGKYPDNTTKHVTVTRQGDRIISVRRPHDNSRRLP